MRKDAATILEIVDKLEKGYILELHFTAKSEQQRALHNIRYWCVKKGFNIEVLRRPLLLSSRIRKRR